MKRLKSVISMLLCLTFCVGTFAACGPKPQPSGDPIIENISIGVMPKTLYTIGDTLDVSAGKLKLHYDDGTFGEIAFTAEGVKISKPDMSTVGSKAVTISYDGFVTNYQITVSNQIYKVKFDLNYNGAPQPQTSDAERGTAVTRPQNPERAGYRFDNWYTEPSCQNAYSFSTYVTADKTLYAGWIKVYPVTFELNYPGAPFFQTNEVDGGTAVSRPQDPSRGAGYVFSGWYNNSQCNGDEYDFSTYVIAETILYAKWLQYLSIKFDLNYPGASEPAAETVLEGTAVGEYDPEPQRDGYRFDGWFTASVGGTRYVFSSAVTTGFTLYAHWTVLRAVTFDLNYADAPDGAVDYVPDGEAVIKPQDPAPRTVDGNGVYIFKYWSLTVGGAEYSFDTAVTGAITLYAVWEFTESTVYTVTFNYNYPNAPVSGTGSAVEDTPIVQPQSPSRPDAGGIRYSFGGWYTDADGTTGNEYNFATPVTQSFTLYAKWNVSHYLVSFKYNYSGNTGNVETQWVLKNAGAARPAADPSRPATQGVTGYSFGGWYTDTACTAGNEYVFDSPITTPLELYAKWNVNQYILTFVYNFTGRETEVLTTRNVTPGGTVGSNMPNNPSVGELYTFEGWYTNAACTAGHEFTSSTTVNSALTLYAKWGTKGYAVTFVINFPGRETEVWERTVNESPGLYINIPNAPSIAEYWFSGWYTNAGCTAGNKFDFDNTVINSSFTLYAKWLKGNVFEAEYTYICDEFSGSGWSNGTVGKDIIVKDPGTIGASNGYFVKDIYTHPDYNYQGGIEYTFIEFVITSSADVSDAVLDVRLSADWLDTYIAPTERTIDGHKYFPVTFLTSSDIKDTFCLWEGCDCGGYKEIGEYKTYDYQPIALTGAIDIADEPHRRPFTNHIITTSLELKAGVNVIRLVVANFEYRDGTVYSVAPMIDNIRVYTNATLTWSPITSNIK